MKKFSTFCNTIIFTLLISVNSKAENGNIRPSGNGNGTTSFITAISSNVKPGSGYIVSFCVFSNDNLQIIDECYYDIAIPARGSVTQSIRSIVKSVFGNIESTNIVYL